MQHLFPLLTPTNQIIECHPDPNLAAEVVTIRQGTTQSLSTFELDVPGLDWAGAGARPEGLFITQLENGNWWVVFIEMKTSNYLPNRSKAQLQLANAVTHFCKARTGSHGDAHHQEWTNQNDPLPYLPDQNHRVGAVMIVSKVGDRWANLNQISPPTAAKSVRTRIYTGSFINITPVSKCGKPSIGLDVDANDLVP